MNYWTASILLPGWGQFCEGRFKMGLLYFTGTFGGFLIAWWFGLMVWLFNIRDAYVYLFPSHSPTPAESH